MTWTPPEIARKAAEELCGVGGWASPELRDRLAHAISRACAAALEDYAERRQKMLDDYNENPGQSIGPLMTMGISMQAEADITDLRAEATRYTPPPSGEGGE